MSQRSQDNNSITQRGGHALQVDRATDSSNNVPEAEANEAIQSSHMVPGPQLGRSGSGRGRIQRRGVARQSNTGLQSSGGIQRRSSGINSTSPEQRRRRSSGVVSLSQARRQSEDGLYPHYTRGRQRDLIELLERAIPNFSNSQQVRDQFFNAVENARLDLGLTQDEIERLPVHQIVPPFTAGLIPRVCHICQFEISIGSDVVLLPCGHYFHRDCCVESLKDKNQCPRHCAERPDPREPRVLMHAWEDNSTGGPEGLADNMSFVSILGINLVFLRS